LRVRFEWLAELRRLKRQIDIVKTFLVELNTHSVLQACYHQWEWGRKSLCQEQCSFRVESLNIFRQKIYMLFIILKLYI
jgi:hypothetical protein